MIREWPYLTTPLETTTIRMVAQLVEKRHRENRQTATFDTDLLRVAFGGQQDNPTVKLGISLSVEIDPVLPKKMVDLCGATRYPCAINR
jgi:hypothetical protein